MARTIAFGNGDGRGMLSDGRQGEIFANSAFGIIFREI